MTVVEDEYRFLLICSALTDLRKARHYCNWPTINTYIKLLIGRAQNNNASLMLNVKVDLKLRYEILSRKFTVKINYSYLRNTHSVKS